MSDILVSLHKVYKTIKPAINNTNILTDISFQVYQGECLGIIGPSGAGKSTLGLIIQGIIKPSSGKVSYFLPKNKKKYSIQTIFQNPESSLNPRMTIRQILLEPLILLKKNKKNYNEIIEEILFFSGLPFSILSLFPSQISGGQKQRIAIARALVSKASLIICDEPTSALDPINQQKILNFIQKAKTELKTTFIFISHDLFSVQFLSDRIAVLENGSLVEINDKNEIFTCPQKNLTRELVSANRLLYNFI